MGLLEKMRLVNACAAITITATALLGQPQGISGQEKRRAQELLASPAWSDKAWGAYLAGRLHADDLAEQLIEQVRRAEPLRAAPSHSEEHAFTAVLFDALIQGGITVPAKSLEPFEESWAVPVLILASRNKDNEDLLFGFGREKSRDAVWLAANNLLFGRKSQRWYETIWRDIAVMHRFDVTDATESSGYGVIGTGIGGSTCGDGVLAMPKGFPPVAIYTLQDHPFAGSVVLAEGPQTVFYRRTIVPTDKQVGFGSCTSEVNRDAIRVGYIARLRGESIDDTERLLRTETHIDYTNDQDFARRTDASMRTQEAELRRLFEVIAGAGLHPPESDVWIRPEVNDKRRRTPADPLPMLQPRKIQLH